MPVFRANGDLHYFAHVPKCGGTSVEVYLRDRFGSLALFETDRHLHNPANLWNRTAVQHVPIAALERMIPPGWFASAFAVVRHPVRRLVSAFHYARDVQMTLPTTTEINAWFKDAASWVQDQPYRLGGHFLPQTQLVPATARVFRIEDGLDQIIPYLDALAGNSDGPRVIRTVNVGKWRAEQAAPDLTDETLGLAARVYAADFARFGYVIPTLATDLAALPDLPALPATGKPPAVRRRTPAQRLYRQLVRKASSR